MRQPVRRLLMMSDAPHFGGAERYAIAMARAAQCRGIRARIAWLRPSGTADGVFEAAARDGIDVIDVPIKGTYRPWNTFRTVGGLLAVERPDAAIVNACGRAGFWAVPWAARWAGVPSAWVHHMVDDQDYRRLTPRWFGGRVEGPHLWRLPQTLRHRMAAAGASAVVALNAQDRELIAAAQGVSPRRITTIPNGVDCEQYCFDPPARERVRAEWIGDGRNPRSPFIVGTAGRLVDGKGVDLLIEAAALACARDVPVLVVIAGEGPQRIQLEKLARERGVAPIIRFVGFVEDMPAFYSGLDVFVLASETESFGLVLAEAMACERPVIATPTAGARLQIEPDATGRLLHGFTAEELATCLWELWDEQPMTAAMGRNGRARAIEQFSIDLTLERTLRLLRSDDPDSTVAVQRSSPFAARLTREEMA